MNRIACALLCAVATASLAVSGCSTDNSSGGTRGDAGTSGRLTGLGLLAVAYRDGAGTYQIFAVSRDGKTRTQLTRRSLDDGKPANNFLPAWSPDGKRIAYMGQSSDGSPQIRAMNADGGNDQALTTPLGNGLGVNETPRWSPDGSMIVYTSGARTVPDPLILPATHIWIMRADGQEKKQITFGDFSDHGPTWSPDGRYIAFASNRDGGRFHLWRINADGTAWRQLTGDALTVETDSVTGLPIEQKVPAWSPDGKYIAHWNGVEQSYLSPSARSGGPLDETDKNIARSWRIWVMRADGSEHRNLTEGDEPAWSPDSQMVLFPLQNAPLGVGSITVDGANSQLLITTPNGSPAGFSWQPVE